MIFQQLFGPDVNVIEDRRASKRDIGVPSEVRSESSYQVGDRAKQIDALLRAEEIPVVFIDSSGNVWVLTAGGSGLIVFESSDSQPIDDYQAIIVETVQAELKKHFAVKDKKTKKVKADEVLLGVVEPEFPTDWSDVISDVDLAEADE